MCVFVHKNADLTLRRDPDVVVEAGAGGVAPVDAVALLELTAFAEILVRFEMDTAWAIGASRGGASFSVEMDVLTSSVSQLCTLYHHGRFRTHIEATATEEATPFDEFAVVANILVHAQVGDASIAPAGNHGLGHTAVVDPSLNLAFLVHPGPVRTATA